MPFKVTVTNLLKRLELSIDIPSFAEVPQMRLIPIIKKWLPPTIAIVAFAIVIEQFIVLRGLDHLSVRQQDVYQEYIASLGPPLRPYRENDVGLLAYECVSRPIGIVYSYKLCVKTARRQPNGQPQYSLLVIRPAGYFTLVPWNSADRILWDSRFVFLFYDGKVTQRVSLQQE